MWFTRRYFAHRAALGRMLLVLLSKNSKNRTGQETLFKNRSVYHFGSFFSSTSFFSTFSHKERIPGWIITSLEKIARLRINTNGRLILGRLVLVLVVKVRAFRFFVSK